MTATGELGYHAPQVCKIVGISYRQLDYWARTGLLRPSLADAKGSGSQRVYSYQDLLELKVVKQLLDAGVNLQKARRALACLRDSGEELAAVPLSGVLDEVNAAIVEIGEDAALAAATPVARAAGEN
jgi:DNA-binding transcriptional MerR regulator